MRSKNVHFAKKRGFFSLGKRNHLIAGITQVHSSPSLPLTPELTHGVVLWCLLLAMDGNCPMLAGIGFASPGSFSPWLGLFWKSQKRAKGCQDVSCPPRVYGALGVRP